MTWTVVVSDNFTRANTSPGGAGTTTGAGNGWIDNAGGIWQISSNTLLGTSASTTGYTNETLLRPTTEDAVGARITCSFVGNPTADFGSGLRVQTGGDYYLCEASTTQLFIYKVISGTPTALATVALSTATVTGDAYTLDFYVSGTSPTSLSATLTNNTTSTVIGTATASDSSATLQVTGTYALVIWSSNGSAQTVNYTQATTYTGSPTTATITLTPTSIVGGTTGNVITVTGSGTTFSGTPFTLSGGLGALITAQTVSSTTAGTVTISAGVQGYGLLTVDDSADGASATLTVTTPSLGALNIGWIGDSITYGTNGAPVTEAVAKLTAMGYTVTSTNRGISGSSTSDWAAGGTDLTAAMSAFATAGVTIVHIMLGTNDVRTPNSFTPAQHFTNMRGIVLALVAAGYKVVISKPLYTVPNAMPGTPDWPNDPNSVYLEYFTLDMQLVDGIRIFKGDTGGYEISSLSPTTFLASDGVHPANSTENNILGDYWATALVERFGNQLSPIIAQTINRYYLNEGDA